jgi:hypothetical protein
MRLSRSPGRPALPTARDHPGGLRCCGFGNLGRRPHCHLRRSSAQSPRAGGALALEGHWEKTWGLRIS